jgi:tartrate-resistant acid phosphatase type 5
MKILQSIRFVAVAIIALGVSGCAAERPIPKVTEVTYEPQVIAVVGDFGVGDKNQRAVSKLVAKYNPDFVVTTGDNVYKKGKSYDRLVGKYYPQPLVPATGNHDYMLGIKRFDSYFGTTSETRNYVYHAASGVDFFILDSDAGVRSWDARQDQWNWLVRAVAKSTANFQVVVLHHPPYSSSTKHGSTKVYQWAFRSMGVDLVLSGHDHDYERIVRDDLNYIVDGAGGAKLYKCKTKEDLVEGSLGCHKKFGALFINATKDQLQVVFRTIKGVELDAFTIEKSSN